MSKLQSPRGTHDLFGEDIDQFNYIINTARSIAAHFGFSEVKTPIFEFSPVFAKSLGDSSDIVNKEMYVFEDRGGEQLTLRPEGTAGIARAFLSNGLTRNIPLKWFYQGPMFRYERPQKGRTRQFHQLGVEILGAKDYKNDLDCISLAHKLLTQLCPDQSITLELNSIGDNESRNTFRQKLIDYLTPFKNELSEDSQKRLVSNPLRILDSKNKEDQKICESAPKLIDCFNTSSKETFDLIKQGLNNLNIPFSISDQLVRGLDYYSHCVFEFKSDKLGAQNTVLAGGRYDHLIQQMGGPELSGVGFAAGIERLLLIMPPQTQEKLQTAILCLDKESESKCIELCYQLRSGGILCEIIDSGNMSKKMKKADKIGAQVAIIVGQEELSKNQVIIKDLKKGEQNSVELTGLVQEVKRLLTSS